MVNLWIIYGLWWLMMVNDGWSWLVGGDWNMTFIFPFSWEWNVIIPIDELIFFRGVETTNQLLFNELNNWTVTLDGLLKGRTYIILHLYDHIKYTYIVHVYLIYVIYTYVRGFPKVRVPQIIQIVRPF